MWSITTVITLIAFSSIHALEASARPQHVSPPNLLVKITGASSVAHVDDLRVVTIVKNTAEVPIKLLDHPDTPLSQLPTDIFDIARHCGARPEFMGYRVFVEASEASDYLTLNPGQSIQVYHDVSKIYDFTSSGPGNYTIQIKPHLAYYHADTTADGSQAIGSTSAALADAGLVVSILDTGRNLKTVHSNDTIAANSFDFSCTDEQREDVKKTIPVAQGMTQAALSHLDRDVHGTSAEFIKWFGPVGKAGRDIVFRHFQNMDVNNLEIQKYTYFCSTKKEPHWRCNEKATAGADEEIANTNPDEPFRIYLCDKWFHLPQFRREEHSRAGALVHENSHFVVNGGTNYDAVRHAVGPEEWGARAALNLAQHPRPDLTAVNNADNHAYFAAQVCNEKEGKCSIMLQAYEHSLQIVL